MTAAEAFLTEEYEGSKAEVQRTVAAKLGDAAAAVDLDGAYNEAWHALYLRLESGEDVDNHKAFLVTVTYRRALSERRAGRLERAADTEELVAIGVEPDIDAQLDAEMQLRHFAQGLRAQLDERELRAAVLCHLYGMSRPEAAELIGIAPRRMEKLMDRASKRINAVIGAVRPGELCDEFDSMVRAFAVGMLDEEGERYQLAREHLETCPSCRRKVLTLRGLGAIAPLPAVFGTLAGAAAVGATAAGKGVAGKAGLAKVGGKLAGVSHKAALIGGAVATTGAVAAVAAVAVVSSGGGHHGAHPTGGGEPMPVAVGAAVAGEESAAPSPPASHRVPHKSAPHRTKGKSHHHHEHPHNAAAPATQPPPATPEPEPEATPEVAPEPSYEPPPAPEPAPEPTPEPAPEPSSTPSESKPPLKDASVEFELH